MSSTTTCPRILKITFTASAEPPGRARPARHFRWHVKITSIIWSLWRKCWDIKSPWSGLATIGSQPTPLNRLPPSADLGSGGPGGGGARAVQRGGPRLGHNQRNPNPAHFPAHFSDLAPRKKKRPNPRPQRILKNPPQKRKNDPGRKRKVRLGLPKIPNRMYPQTTIDPLLKFYFVPARPPGTCCVGAEGLY